MGCKHCSFKSYCIKPWIPAITKLQNGNKKGKMPLPPWGQPSRPLPGRSPSPAPSQRRPAASTEKPGPTLARRLRPRPGVKVKGEGFPAPPQAPRARGSGGKFGAGWASAALSPRPSRTCRARPAPRPAPRGARVRGGCAGRAHPAPTHPSRTWFRRQEPEQGAHGRDPAGRGEENTPETHTRAHTRPPVGREVARGAGTPPAGHLAARGRGGRGDRRGRGEADTSGPRWAGPASRPPPPAGPRAPGRWGRAGHSAATPGGASVPEDREACDKDLCLPLPRDFNLK